MKYTYLEAEAMATNGTVSGFWGKVKLLVQRGEVK